MFTQWVNSADSHVLEPLDLWHKELPASFRERGLRVATVDGRELVYIDSKVVRRDPVAFMDAIQPPGAEDPIRRLADLDDQGIWCILPTTSSCSAPAARCTTTGSMTSS
jgi:hypothetical protein